MYLVLGEDRMKSVLDENVVEHWFNAYIELLQRLRLNNEATNIIKLSSNKKVNEMSLLSTVYFSNCSTCGKALSERSGKILFTFYCSFILLSLNVKNFLGAWFCVRCKLSRSNCALCQLRVKGILAWCRGCSHGGHQQCMKNWFQETGSDRCPSGCGHHCQITNC